MKVEFSQTFFLEKIFFLRYNIGKNLYEREKKNEKIDF